MQPLSAAAQRDQAGLYGRNPDYMVTRRPALIYRER
jgi:hypothetical protein